MLVGCAEGILKKNEEQVSMESANAECNITEMQVLTEMQGINLIQLEELPNVVVSKSSQIPLVEGVGEYNANLYVYSTLSDKCKGVYNRILETLLAHQNDKEFQSVNFNNDSKLICVVDLVGDDLTSSEIFDTLNKVLVDNPSIFYVADNCYYYYGDNVKNLYIMAEPKYSTLESREAVYNIIDQCVNEVKNLVGTTNGNTAECVKIVADYIMKKYEYASDANGVPIITVDTATIVALSTSKAICSGYAKTFSFLCSQVGIDTIYVVGMVPEGYHAWNYVYLPETGNYYACDITFSDGGLPIILQGESVLVTHIPDYMRGEYGAYYYPLPALSKTNYSSSDINNDVDIPNNDELDNKNEETDAEDNIIYEWSDWIDFLPNDVNETNAIIESKELYRYQYNDIRIVDEESSDLINQGYTLVSKNEEGVSEWSDYSTSKPTFDNIEIQEKKEYRYRTREYTESEENNLEGWTLYNSYNSNGSWSEWSVNVPGNVVNIETREVDDLSSPIYATYYQYSRYSIYGSDGCWHTGPTAASISYWGGTPSFTSTGWLTSQKPYYKWSNANCAMYGDWTDQWYNEESKQELIGYNKKTEYRYQTSKIINQFYRDSAWSEWSDNYVAIGEVQERDLYRYRFKTTQYTYLKVLPFTEWQETPRNDDWVQCETKTVYRWMKK